MLFFAVVASPALDEGEEVGAAFGEVVVVVDSVFGSPAADEVVESILVCCC